MCLQFQELLTKKENPQEVFGPYYKVVFYNKGNNKLVSPWAKTYLEIGKWMQAMDQPEPEDQLARNLFRFFLSSDAGEFRDYGFTAFSNSVDAKRMRKDLEDEVWNETLIPIVVEVYLRGNVVSGLCFVLSGGIMADEILIKEQIINSQLSLVKEKKG